jgi:MFS transporter, PAT family, beta-lactamase induction signal transducer AmpG
MTFPSANPPWRNPRILLCILTGFSSGLPLFILISLLTAWLRESGVDLKAIGLLALVQFPYVWKFLWAPLCDRYGFRFGRRRSWMLVSQILLLAAIPAFGFLSPTQDMRLITLLAIGIAFLSASQDIAIDAYRRELLRAEEMGLGNVVHVNAYKIAGLIPGSLSLILADHVSWTWVYAITSLFMLPGLIMTLLISEPHGNYHAPPSLRQAVIEPFQEFIQRKGIVDALLLLAFIFSYKLGDSMATALATPFYLDLGYSKTEIGLIAKNAGLWCNVAGGILGGVWMMRLGENRSLWIFGLLQALVILGFAWLANQPHEAWRLALVIGAESFGVGLGTAAFVAFVANSTHPAYAATQFALFTSLAATPRTVANAMTGFLVEGGHFEVLGHAYDLPGLGWQNFFLACFIAAVPGMLLLLRIAPWRTLATTYSR